MVLRQYIRNKSGQVVGVLVAYKNDVGVHVGWSKCNTKLDKYDRALGEKIAMGRAAVGTETPVPHTLKPLYEKFSARAEKYFNNPAPKRGKFAVA